MIEKHPVVYILANKYKGTLYTGVTCNLSWRVWKHKQGDDKGFSWKYDTKRLVYYEMHDEVIDAIVREKQIKKWRRIWKIALVENFNPNWRDLYPDIVGG